MFRGFAEQVIGNAQADVELKGKILEILCVLASEATAPKPQRRGTAMWALTTELATLCSGVASLAQLYQRRS